MKLFLHRHSNHTGWQSGFSLMEILVVLSCIVVLALIAYTDLYGSIEKARIARLIRFESQVDHALGPALVGDWTFDDLTTNQTTVMDSSTGRNDLTVCTASGDSCAAAAANAKCYPPVASGECLQGVGMGQCFDTTGGTLNQYWLGALHSATLGVEGGKKNRTVSLWVKFQPDASGNYPVPPQKQVLVEKYQEYAVKLWSGMYYVNANNQIYVEYHTSNGALNNYYQKVFFDDEGGIPRDNKWHHVVVVWDNMRGKIAAYLDGVKEVTDMSAAPNNYSDPTVWGNFAIGRNAISSPSNACSGGGNPFTTGLIDRVRVYNEAFPI